MADRVVASAPAKAMLFGEYAVLEGAPALVAAIEVRAVAHALEGAEAPPPATAVVACSRARARRRGLGRRGL